MTHKTLGDLGDRDLGRVVTLSREDGAPHVTALLTGVAPVGSSVRLALKIAGADLYTGFLPAATPVLIHPKEKRP